MASRRVRGDRILMKAYAGVDPATGRETWLYDSIGVDAGKRKIDDFEKALDASALELKLKRRDRRRNPAAPRPPRRRPARDRTVGEAVEAWWKHHGSKLASAPKTRGLIDGVVLPHLGDLKIALVAGSPPDDDDERDPDLVYLAEKWAEIRARARKVGEDPLAASTIHRCHGIVGSALRRAGHPIGDPGLPAMGDKIDTTPLPEEMAEFLPFLAGTGRTAAGYTVTRRIAGKHVGDTGRTMSYEVPAREVPTNAMDLMTEAFALLVASGPRPVEAAAITRAQLDGRLGQLSLDGRGVVEARDADGREVWVIAAGETVKRRRRTITLDARVLAVVKRWVAFQDEVALAVGERLGPRALVFSLDPAAVDPTSPKVFSGAFGRAVDRARATGVALPDGFHLYDMRHFGITQLLRKSGGRVNAVAARFGTSERMIWQRYSHAIPRDDKVLAEAMAEVWGAPPAEAEVVELSAKRT